MSSSRMKLMQEDVSVVISVCRDLHHCPFQDFTVDGNVFTFSYVEPKGNLLRRVTFNFSEDYPDQTVVTWDNEADNPLILDGRIQLLVTRIAEDLGMNVHVPLSREPLLDNDSDAVDGHTGIQRTLSNSSHYSDCNSDVTSDECDYDEYYNSKESEDEDMTMHPLLAQEIEIVQNRYGEKSISHRLFGTIDDVDVELHLDMSFLDPEIAKAWKVIREEPIVVRLHLSLSRYLDAIEPKVEVFQPSQKEKFGMGSQLRKILEQFISDTWKTLTNELVEAKLAKSARPRKVGTSVSKKRLPSQVSKDAEAAARPAEGATAMPSGTTAATPAAAAATGNVDDSALAQILDMGFGDEPARNALIITRGDVEQALNLLLSSPESLIGNTMLEDGHGRGPSVDVLPSRVPPPPPPASKYSRTSRDHPLSRLGKGRAKGGGGGGIGGPGRCHEGDEMVEASTSSSTVEDLNLLPSSTQSGKNAKQTPELDNGFLVQLMEYTRQRIPTLNEYCVVCDEAHVFQNGAMLKPAVCARELCVFGFQTLGVMSDAAEDIATGAEVVDLLIAMAVTACRSQRRDVIFDPFPTVVDPASPTELALSPKKKDYKRVEKAMDNFMEMKEMMILVGSDLKKEMDKRDILSYPLLQWIITSNRSHIVKLPPERQISFMHTPHQFLLMSSPPAKEAVFRAARQLHGSTFAFHGSNIENWHSIMRSGLINASGTKHQRHGAAYGKGIYLSPHASLSFGYSGMGYSHHKAQKGSRGAPSGKVYYNKDGKSLSRFLNSKNLTCIALCEVITNKCLRKHSNIWVMPQADYCCTRFFFVYEDGQVGDSNIDTQAEKYLREIMSAVGYQTSEPLR